MPAARLFVAGQQAIDRTGASLAVRESGISNQSTVRMHLKLQVVGVGQHIKMHPCLLLEEVLLKKSATLSVALTWPSSR